MSIARLTVSITTNSTNSDFLGARLELKSVTRANSAHAPLDSPLPLPRLAIRSRAQPMANPILDHAHSNQHPNQSSHSLDYRQNPAQSAKNPSRGINFASVLRWESWPPICPESISGVRCTDCPLRKLKDSILTSALLLSDASPHPSRVSWCGPFLLDKVW